MSENKHSSLDRLGLWILGATVLGAVTGLILGKDAQMFAPMGNLFMQLIKMIVVPLVLFSLIGGAASLGRSGSAGKIGLLTFGYYGITTAVAVALGLAASEFFQPGRGILRIISVKCCSSSLLFICCSFFCLIGLPAHKVPHLRV